MTRLLSRKSLLFCFFCFSSCLLTGCTGLNSSFTCPMQPGVNCSSLDQVNTMIDQGKVGRTKLSVNQGIPVSTLSQSTPIAANMIPSVSTPAWVVRNPETVMKVWIAPYQDQDGSYHQASTLYSVVKPGQWVNVPISTN